jgi:AmmeMemoRadiSam system protein B
MRWVVFCLLVFVVDFGVGASEKVRLSVAAGPLYPMEVETLRRVVNNFCDGAEVREREERLLGCVVPHGGYGLSGDIAGHAFKALKPGQYSRVIVLAPSHFAAFESCSIVAARAYVTPLGFVPIDEAAVRELNFSPLISTRGLRYKSTDFLQTTQYVKLHEEEHSIEAILPFLQERLGNFSLVPILVGELGDSSGNTSIRRNRIESIASTISKIVDERTLIVVSTDFTHYGLKYQYMPGSFLGRELASIEALDREAYDLVVRRDHVGFEEYLLRTQNRICGRGALQVFMKLLPGVAEGQVLATSMSAQKTQDVGESVSYAAINFYDPRKTALAAPVVEPIVVVEEGVGGVR